MLGEVVLDDDAQVILDVPTAILRLDVTLDGARLDAETTNAQERGDVVIFDRETGEVVFRFSAMNDDGSFPLPYSARVVAGRYAVHYERESYRNINSPENNWPVNDERPLQCIAVP